MNSNISCARAGAGANSVGRERVVHRESAAVGARDSDASANQKVAAVAGAANRLETDNEDTLNQPTDWLHCKRAQSFGYPSASANQLGGRRPGELCIGGCGGSCGGGQSNHRLRVRAGAGEKQQDEGEEPVATNNSSQRGDAAVCAVSCGRHKRTQAVPVERRWTCERAGRAASTGNDEGETRAATFACTTAAAAAAATAAAASNTNTNTSIQIGRAQAETCSLLRAPASSGASSSASESEEADPTFWARLSNLTRSIIHQQQQAAGGASGASCGRAARARPVRETTFGGHDGVARGAGDDGGTLLAPEVVGYLESKRQRQRQRQCAAAPRVSAATTCATDDQTRAQLERGPSKPADDPWAGERGRSGRRVGAAAERRQQDQLQRQRGRQRRRRHSFASENMTTTKMIARAPPERLGAAAADEHDEQLALVEAAEREELDDGPGRRRLREPVVCDERHLRRVQARQRVIKPVEFQGTIKMQGRTQQQQVARPMAEGATSSLEHLARQQAAASTITAPRQHNQRTHPTTSATNTTNTASTTRSSASSLSSCVLTETSTARSDTQQPPNRHHQQHQQHQQRHQHQQLHQSQQQQQQQQQEEGGVGEMDPTRLKWDKKMDFLLSIIGFAVDLANIWRFPYLVYKNGGGVFLIPYLAMLVFGGLPLFFLELCLGQYVKKGSITLWDRICPYMKGVGYCSMLVSWYVSFYYNVLIAWSVYFIYRSVLSFGQKMPWEDCDNSWNSPATCVSISQLKEMCAQRTNETLESCRKDLFSAINVTSPASEFFVKELSQIDQSSGLEDMGHLRLELVLCTLVVYLLHYFSLFRGLETSGKVVWVTATAPYMILSILLVRGLFLPGASMGIKYYLSPKLEKLAEPQVWIDAANQVFYSIGVGFGVHLTYASFNSHNNNCHRDCLVTTAVNALTSVYSGLVVFVYLGYMAANLGIEIDKVASEGYSLVFEVYPEALTTLPFARFWSILFFIMLLTLGIDSAMAALEAVITGLEDEFKCFKRLTRAQLTGLVIVSSFLPALISCTQGGAYTLFWFDIYSAGVSLLFAALFETIGVVYCYGLDKFIVNIESMLGRKPHLFYILCWKYISPIFLMGIIFMSIYTAQVPVYRGYTFPVWSIVLGWCLAFSSVSAVPIVALWTWCSGVASPRKAAPCVSPSKSPRKPRLGLGTGTGRKANAPTHGQCKSMSVVSYTGATGGGQSTPGGARTTTTSRVTNLPPEHENSHHGHHPNPNPNPNSNPNPHHVHRYETTESDGVREEMV